MAVQPTNLIPANNANFDPKTFQKFAQPNAHERSDSWNQVLSPPPITTYNPNPAKELKKQNNTDAETSQQTSSDKVVKFFLRNPESIIIAGIGTAILGILGKGKLNQIRLDANTIRSIDSLKDYIVTQVGKQAPKMRKVSLEFPAENYREKLTATAKKGIFDLTSAEKDALSNLPERLDDIVNSINGTKKIVKDSMGKQKLCVVLNEHAQGKEAELIRILNKKEITDTDKTRYADLLKCIDKVETLPAQHELLTGIRKPVVVEVIPYKYINKQADNWVTRFCIWVTEKILP